MRGKQIKRKPVLGEFVPSASRVLSKAKARRAWEEYVDDLLCVDIREVYVELTTRHVALMGRRLG